MKTERSNNAARLHALGNEVSALNGPFHAESYANGEVIYRPGETADRIYLVKSGRVRLMRQGRGNSRALVAILRDGDVFGELLRPEEALMEELAVASGETLIWSIGSGEFRSLIETRPGLALDIIKAMNERMGRMRRRLLGLTFKEVPARLAELLLLLGETHGERCAHGGEIDLRVATQQDLADLLGASRSFVSTLINEMKRDGQLANVGRTLCLRDARALKKLASKER
jgi:CRP/FNR family transcriptional regulator, cyclic AMP receptor protein